MFPMNALAFALLLALSYIGYTLWLLNRNHHAARAAGVPLVICPYDPENYVHSILSVPLRPVYRLLLPASFFATVELSIWGWEFRDKAAIHEQLGPIFILVTTGQNRLVCSDPALAQHILTRRMAFVHPEITTEAMGFLGGNVITARGESWSRQRRIIAQALNDRISPSVWQESAEQASALADQLVVSSATWTTGKPAQTLDGLRIVAINVLAHVAYGHHKHFSLPSPSQKRSWDMSYVDAIAICTEYLMLAAFLPARLCRMPVMPHILQTLGVALTQLPQLTRDMLHQERTSAKKYCLDKRPETIMSALVRLSDEERSQNYIVDTTFEKHLSTDMPRINKLYLTEDEIAGNLFIFTAAGFDTTANTMGYAVTLLTAYPEWQAWIQAEIDTVINTISRTMTDYETCFPRLVRCMAVMLETLRLFPPVTLLMRASETDQSMPATDLSAPPFTICSPCAVSVNVMALHTSKTTWGSDALEFNPSRWINVDSEQLVKPPKGTYIPWSTGPRSCPGQKMSQVEFVAVISTLFGKCSAEPMVENGESFQDGRERLVKAMEDSQPVLTLKMNRPGDVMIRWKER